MKIKKLLAVLAASAMALATMATTAFADEPTVYGQAGISFQVRDSWEHRDAVGVAAFDESGETELYSIYKDVNITGNGDYSVSMEGWACDWNEALLGWLMVDTTLATAKDADGVVTIADYPDMTLTITSFSMDGKEYSAEGLEILAEQNNSSLACWKIVNSWGQVEDPRGMDSMVWATTDPVTINFTIAGLPTDKVTDGSDVVEFVSGEEPVEEPESSVAEESSEEPASSEAPESATDESKAEESSTVAESSSVADDEEGSKLPFILGIGAGVIVAVAAVIVVIKKKK